MALANERQAVRRQQRRREEQQASGYRDWLESEWVNAEAATNGFMLNSRGRAKGIDPRDLWMANSQTRNAYASEELKRYWDEHPIISAAEFSAYAARDETAVNEYKRARATRALYGVY